MHNRTQLFVLLNDAMRTVLLVLATVTVVVLVSWKKNIHTGLSATLLNITIFY